MPEKLTDQFQRLKKEREICQEFIWQFIETLLKNDDISAETVAMLFVETGIELCNITGCSKDCLDRTFKIISTGIYED